MDQDDRPIGIVLTRRQALTALGACGVVALTRCSGSDGSPAVDPKNSGALLRTGCVVRPEQTEGPYFVDERLNRSDVRSDTGAEAAKPGVPLELTFDVSRIEGAACMPLAGVLVDVWQCDAQGVYSGVTDPSFETVGQDFLRGYQITDADGIARFTTIYPGWYRGRTIHIHFKIRSAPTAGSGFEFTSQVYFDDELTDRVHAQGPYDTRGPRSVRNEADGIFRRDGSQLLLTAVPAGAGYAGTFEIALQTG